MSSSFLNFFACSGWNPFLANSLVCLKCCINIGESSGLFWGSTSFIAASNPFLPIIYEIIAPGPPILSKRAPAPWNTASATPAILPAVVCFCSTSVSSAKTGSVFCSVIFTSGYSPPIVIGSSGVDISGSPNPCNVVLVEAKFFKSSGPIISAPFELSIILFVK